MRRKVDDELLVLVVVRNVKNNVFFDIGFCCGILNVVDGWLFDDFVKCKNCNFIIVCGVYWLVFLVVEIKYKND